MSQVFDLDLIAASLPDFRVEWLPETPSTNDHALSMAPGHQGAPLLILTDAQTSGRGRGENVWFSSCGSLTFSVLFDAEQMGVSVDRWPLASMAAGLAVCKSVETFISGAPVSVKWPNDVFLDEKKLCGVLVETNASPRRLIIGVGVNVNTSLADAPREIRARSISLRDFSGQEFSITAVLVRIVMSLWLNLETVSKQPNAMLDQWRDRCLLSGRDIEVAVQGRRVQGQCQGVDQDGALLIDSADGVERVFAGEVIRF